MVSNNCKTKAVGENKMAIYNIASTVLVAGINFLTIPIFTRILDTDGFGVVNIYTAWVQICTIFVGMKADGSIGSAHANLQNDEQDDYQLSCLTMGLLSFVVILGLCLAFIKPLSVMLSMDGLLIIAMVLQSFGAFVIALFSMRFIFRKEPQKNFALSVGVAISTTAVSVVLILSGAFGVNAYLGRVLGLSLPNLLIGICLFFVLVRKGAYVRIRYWAFCLSLTLPLIFHGLSQLLLAQTGKIAIQQVQGNSAAGVYSIAVTVVSLLNAIYNALNNAFVPFMYDDLAGKTSEDKKLSHFRNYFSLFTLGTCAFALMSPEVLKILSTESYWEATRLLPPLVLGQYCVFLYSFPVNYEFYKMQTRSIAVGTMAAAVLNVAVCVLVVPAFGMDGAACSSAIAYLFLFIFHFLIARFLLGDRNYPTKWFAFGLFAVLIACSTCVPADGIPLVRWLAGFACLAFAISRIVRSRSIF